MNTVLSGSSRLLRCWQLAILALFCFGSANAQSSTSTSAGAGETVVITVADVTSSNATSVFTPSQVTAALGATVLFNFTQGNHTATESAFFAPCEPLNFTNSTNGFDSNFQVANASASIFPIATVPILVENDNLTMWFYDVNTCSEGGVGVINLVAGDPATSGQTLAGFIRNAMRLNGTTTTSSGPSSTGSSSSQTASTATQSNSAQGKALGVFSSVGLGTLVGVTVIGLVPLVVL